MREIGDNDALTSLTGIIIQSCCKGYQYKWTYIITDNLFDNSINYYDSIPVNAFGIRIHLFNRKFASNFQNVFVNELQAYRCEEIYSNEDSIVELKLITLYGFNSEHEGLSDVSDLFLGYTSDITIPINELITNINNNVTTSIGYFDLLLNDENISDTMHRFIVKIELSDNRILIDTTQAVQIY